MNRKYKNGIITGGAGFIGSNLARRLLKEGYKICIIDNFSTGKIENIKDISDEITVIEGDIRNTKLVNQSVKNQNYIFHFAAMANVQNSIEDPLLCNDININGTLNLLEAARINNIDKFIFASSSAVYGDNPSLPKTEDMIPEPLSPYAVSKITSEYYCKIYSKLYKMKTIAFRYFNIYGPYQNPDSEYSAVIPKFIKLILDNKTPIIYGDGKQSRDFIYIDDVIDYNITALQNNININHTTVNCACGENTDLLTLLKNISNLVKKDIKPIFGDERSGDIKHSYADIKKLIDIFKFAPKTSLKQGLKLTLDWINKNNK